MKRALAIWVLVATGAPLLAHRLDEYLQATLVSIDHNSVQAQITLTPGVAVSSFVASEIDVDGNGSISDGEQRAYAGRVLNDLSLAIDGRRLKPRLISIRFPTLDEMNEGLGEIHLDFDADLPSAGRRRMLTLENHHNSRIAAYQVNCLVPTDPRIRIAAQVRNHSQSRYELHFEDTEAPAETAVLQGWSGGIITLSPVALFLFLRIRFLKGRRLL